MPTFPEMPPRTNRREFLLRGVLSAGVLASGVSRAAATKMKICLNPGSLGVKANLAESIAMAAKYGFQAIDPNIKELAALSDSALQDLRAEMHSRNVEFGQSVQAVPVGQTEEKFAAYLQDLAGIAKAMERAGMRRFGTWLTPVDNQLTYLQNFRLHTRRIAEVANVLAAHGVFFGLEYVGPKTSWSRGKYPFIHTMESMKELIAETGRPNVGFVIDSWHWHTSGETPADLLTLKGGQISGVHLNDAPAGVPIDQLLDNVRALPLATGVIDAAGFLNALNRIGFDGPVEAEPFDAELRKLPPDEALAKTSLAMHKAFALLV
jgi:sugar phosphate isomerase/epimerase